MEGGRNILSDPGLFICTRATRTRSTACMGPATRAASARRFPAPA